MKMMTKNSPALQEALVGFLSITGQGMSAWMMQSMSNSTSDKIKKEYANEMMKQQTLKICHNNVKMVKELTETNRKCCMTHFQRLLVCCFENALTIDLQLFGQSM